MNDDQFIENMQSKIERLVGRSVSLIIDDEDGDRMEVDLEGDEPRVMVGTSVLKYPGFARMCVEFSVASITRGRQIEPLEFQIFLARN